MLCRMSNNAAALLPLLKRAFEPSDPILKNAAGTPVCCVPAVFVLTYGVFAVFIRSFSFSVFQVQVPQSGMLLQKQAESAYP